VLAVSTRRRVRSVRGRGADGRRAVPAARLLVACALASALVACSAGALPRTVSGSVPRVAEPDAIRASAGPSVPAAGATTPPATPPPTAGPVLAGTFDVDLASEASGLVAGRRDPSVLWILDDGPGTTSLLAVDRTGTTLGVVEMAGVEGRDTEALAVGPCGPGDPSPCLYVGDVGDNAGVREDVQVHRFPEPAPDAGVVDVTTATFTHRDGPRDVEGMVVDADGLPVLFTKEQGLTRLVRPEAFADGPLVPLAAIPLPRPARPLLTTIVGLTVTAADLSADGTRLLLRTYDSVLELTAPAHGSADATGDGPDLARASAWAVAELPAAAEAQGEAVAHLPDGRGYATVSEGSGDIWVVGRP
jgi:hypothetical protein